MMPTSAGGRVVVMLAVLAGAVVLSDPLATRALAQGSLWSQKGHGEETYVVFDPLFMQRDTGLRSQPLVINGDTQATAIDTTDLLFPVAPGLRLLYGRHGPGRLGWEVGYVGVYGMFADAAATGTDNLEIAPPLSSAVASLRDASTARATYGSALNMAEANFLITQQSFARPRASAYAFEGHACTATLDWLVGVRWAGLDENAAIDLASSVAGIGGDYRVRSTSNLVGGQLGLRGRAEWQAVAVEGWGKAALTGAFLSTLQDPLVDAITGDVYRTGRSAQAGGVSGVFDFGGALVVPLGEHWGLRFGATMLCLAGVALAPNQFDFSTDQLAGTTVNGGQTLWLGGASFGLEGRW